MKWIAMNGDNWLVGMHIVQCELNKCPSRVRGNLTPYSIYYGCPNTTSYSTILGKAYTEAQTEYGLILAKKVLEAFKKHNVKQQLFEEEIRSIIRKGDRIFNRCSKDDTIDPKEALADKFISILVECDIPHDDAVVMETNFNDDDDGAVFDDVEVPDKYSYSPRGTKSDAKSNEDNDVQVPDTDSSSAQCMKSDAETDEENDVFSVEMDKGKEEVINIGDDAVPKLAPDLDKISNVFYQVED
jgi:hypothetical protein